MLLKQMLEVYELLDTSTANGKDMKAYFERLNPNANVEVYQMVGDQGVTDMIKIRIPGIHGKMKGFDAPTIGVLGRLGGVGARPEIVGFVADGDGALIALTVAAKLLDMQAKGDYLDGDVFVSTHICPCAPTMPHYPTTFMGSPINIAQMNREEVFPELDALLSIDATKGNRILTRRGFAITPTVKDGYILRVSEDLLDIMQDTSSELPVVLPITTQDITPYGNNVFHLNSIVQPATATSAPVVGVATTVGPPVAGCATNVSQFPDMEMAARFVLETAKAFGKGTCKFYDPKEFELLQSLYGSMEHLKTMGNQE